MMQRGCAGRTLMMMGIEGSHSKHLARTQANADIDHPDEAIGKGSLIEGHAPHGPGRVDADDRQPDHPMEDRLRTRCLADTERQCQQSQDARDRAKADAGLSKELQGHVDHIDLRAGGEAVEPRLELPHASLGRLEGLRDLISLGLDARLLSSLVAFPLAALLGLVFPLIPAVVHFGQLAHDASLRGNSNGTRPWRGGQSGPKMSLEYKISRYEMHQCATGRGDGILLPPPKGSP